MPDPTFAHAARSGGVGRLELRARSAPAVRDLIERGQLRHRVDRAWLRARAKRR